MFLNFRTTKNPYQLCQHILETCATDYILFEAAGLIKTALVREWTSLPDENIISLRQYLLNYILNKPNLALFVRERILQVIAIMVKRGSVVDQGAERRVIIGQVELLINSGDKQKQLLGCSMISALMQEYATTVKSSDVGLSWELHFKAKKQFELTDLKTIMNLSIRSLDGIIKAGINEDNVTVLKQLLCIAESVLTWGFIHMHLPKRLVGVFEGVYESDNSPALRLNHIWYDIAMNEKVLDLFFTMYYKVRTNPQLAHHARNCLVQWASLSGAVARESDDKAKYLGIYMDRFINLLCNIQIMDQEALGIAHIIRKLMTFFRGAFKQLPPDVFRSYMEQMTRVTCVFAEGAAQEETMCSEDCMYIEAFERVLQSWPYVLSEPDLFPVEYRKEASMQIFNVYLKCHLSPPDGTRGIGVTDSEEIDTCEENDRTKFKEQLQIIGKMIFYFALSLTIMEGQLRAKIGTSIVQRRKAERQ